MEATYYVPDFDEFHPGFDFESCSGSSKLVMIDFSGNNPPKDISKPVEHWVKDKFDPYRHCSLWSSIYNFKTFLETGSIRVKCLDREDIEGEGFEFVESLPAKHGQPWRDMYCFNGTYNLFFCKHPSGAQHHITITSPVTVLFIGLIKNKSEFNRKLSRILILT